MTMPIEFDIDSKHELSWNIEGSSGLNTNDFMLNFFNQMISLLKNIHNG
jgi:hypothetical protein